MYLFIYLLNLFIYLNVVLLGRPVTQRCYFFTPVPSAKVVGQ